MKVIAIMLLSIGFIGCSTLSEEQCKSGNWEMIGQQDGAKGLNSSRVLKHQEACSEYGISVDNALYNKGYDRGVVTFCTKENGFNTGRNGKTNPRVCPTKLQSAFDKAYNEGRKYYLLEKEIKELEDQIDKVNIEIDETYAKEETEKKSYSSSRRTLQRKRSGLEKKLRRLERQLDLLNTTSLIKQFIKA